MNVIVLTTGISGSSVITGFLAKSGLWVGDDTVYKDNITGKYETYENTKLVDLNNSLFEEVGLDFEGKAQARYDSNTRNIFNDIHNKINTSEYEGFMDECNSHSPWIWKDPRLTLTIGFWKNYLNLADTKVIVLHRNSYELWKSQAIKRVIYSYRYLKESEDKTRQQLVEYLELNGFSHITLEYDQFTSNPTNFIDYLNKFIGTNLTTGDWEELYRPTSKFSQIKRSLLAFLIYFRNYKNRIR